MKTSKLLLFFLFIFSVSLVAQNELPIKQNSVKLKPLFSLTNSSLQSNLEKELNMNSSWKSLIQQNKMAVGLVDLSNPKLTKYASINGNHMMYAASLPKISILLAATKLVTISFNIELAALGLLGNKIKLLFVSAPIDCKVS